MNTPRAESPSIFRRFAGPLTAFVALAATQGLLVGSAAGQVRWNESVNGDLSGTRATPTLITTQPGSNIVSGSMGSGDLDYFRIVVGPGQTLTALNLVAYQPGDPTSFVGLQSGTAVTVNPSAPDPSPLLGWTHFGTGPNNVGTDILPSIGFGGGAIGFTGALGAGNYSFWVQQLSGTTGYSFNLVLVPAPASAALLPIAACVLGRRRRPMSN